LYNGVNKQLNEYQTVYEQISRKGLFPKSISNYSKQTVAENNKDIIFDSNLNETDLQYLTSTGILEFYNSLYSISVKKIYEERGYYQDTSLRLPTNRYGITSKDSVDSKNVGPAFFLNQFVGKINYYDKNFELVNFDNLKSIIDDKTKLFVLCEFTDIEKNPFIKNSDIVCYNKYFLLSIDQNGLKFKQSNTEIVSYDYDPRILENFYSLSVMPEHVSTYSEPMPEKIQFLDYIEQEQKESLNNIIKRI
jgi:hypothetical protein